MAWDVVLSRLGIALGLGLLIGLERERHGRSAGVRTNIVVAVSSCLLMILSLELPDLFGGVSSASVVRLDPSRIGSYAVAGMGFLGAGAIIQGKGSVRGLTTAATLWLANAVGLATGAGYVLAAVLTTGLALAALILFRSLVRYTSRDIYRRIYLDFESCADRMPEISSLLEGYGVKILFAGFECRFDLPQANYDLALRLKSDHNWSGLTEALRNLPGLTRVRWTEGYVP